VYARLDPPTATKALYVRAFSHGEPTRLTTGDPSASYPTWSPDGKWIACEIQGRGGTHAGVVPATAVPSRR
jgi:Tol biopolymer transport system component